MPTQTRDAHRGATDANGATPPRKVRIRLKHNPDREPFPFELAAWEARKPLTVESFVPGHFGGLVQAHGEQIKRLRKERGISQDGLARLTGLTYATIRRIENNYNANPRLLTMCQIAEALGVDVKSLLPDGPPYK